MRCTIPIQRAALTALSHPRFAELGDFDMCDFVDDLLADQRRDVKKASDKVAQLLRVGPGHGTWDWDQKLLSGEQMD